MADIFLTADQLAEKVTRGYVEWLLTDGDMLRRDSLPAQTADAALTELVRRLKTAEDALKAAEEMNRWLDQHVPYPDPGQPGFAARSRLVRALAAIRPNPEP